MTHAINRDDSQHDDNRQDDSQRHPTRNLTDLEKDIQGIRAHMDSTLEEIEFRLSPGQLSGQVSGVMRDVIEGRPTRVATAIRNNPFPVALIGLGALWLAWAVSRTPSVATAPDGMISDQHTHGLLAGLVNACQQGTLSFREADVLLGDAALSPSFKEISIQFERATASLEQEFLKHGGQGVIRMDKPGEPIPSPWLLTAKSSRATIIAALDGGVGRTLDLFRAALHEPLRDDLRVVLGAHFHDLEQIQHRVDALSEAVS